MAFKPTDKELRSFSLTRALVDASSGHGLQSGLEYEMLKEYADTIGSTFAPDRFSIPWQILARRDMTVAGASGSNYLVPTDTSDAVQALRPWSVVMQSGCTVLPDLRGDMAIPKVTAEVGGYWLTSEVDPIAKAQPTIGQVTMTPKICGAVVAFSQKLRTQSNIDAFLTAHLLQTIGRTLDAAALNGSGVSGQPTGLLNTNGFYAQVGTSLAHAGIQNMLQNVADAGALDEALGVVATPSVRELLALREVAPGSGLLWDGRTVAGLPARATPDVPAARLILGAWSELLVGLWSPPEIMVNPYANFQAGILQMRVMLHADVAVRQPAAFAVASSIT